MPGPYSYDIAVYAVPVLLTAGFAGALSLFVLVRERLSSVSIAFFFVSMGVTFWLGGFAAANMAPSEAVSLKGFRIAFSAIVFIPLLNFWFTVSVLKKFQLYQRFIVFLALISSFFWFFSFRTPFFVSDVIHYDWGRYYRAGPLHDLFLGVLAIVAVSGIFLLWCEYRRAEAGSTYKNRVRMFSIAVSIGYLAVLDLLPAYGVGIYPPGYLFALIFLGISAWTIWRHRLADITPSFAARQIIEAMSDGLFVTDLDGKIRVLNESSLKLLQKQRSELTDKSIFTTMPHLMREALYREVVFSGKNYQHTCAWRREKDVVFLDMSTSLFRDSRNEPAGFIFLVRDVSEKTASENRLKELKVAMENAVEGICKVGDDGCYENMNPAYAALLGEPVEGCRDRKWRDHFAAAEFEKLETAVSEMRLHGKAELEVRMRHRDKREFDARIMIIRSPGERGGFEGFYCFAKDITQQKYEKTVEIKSEMISTVSHELRTPLHAVREGVNILLEGICGNLTEEQKDVLMTTQASLDRLVRLVNNVLDFQRLESGTASFYVGREDINALIQETSQHIRQLLRDRDIRFRLDLKEGSLWADCDRDRFSQVLTNLLSNALRFTERGQISIKSYEEKGFAWVSVADTGIGIHEKDLNLLFQKFGQIEAAKDVAPGGTGLGLVISRKIVEEHGGRIEVQSRWGQGSVFRFSLPKAGACRNGVPPVNPEKQASANSEA